MKIFITRKLPERSVQQLKDAGYVVEMWNSDDPVQYEYMVKMSNEIVGLLCTLSDHIDEKFIKSSKNLKVISTMSVGYDHIDTLIAKAQNIRVGNTPGYLFDAIAELCVGLLLTVSRRITEGINVVKEGTMGAWKPFWLCGYELRNSTVGIVGLGNIGKGIAKRLRPFGVKHFYAYDLFIGKIDEDIIVEPNLSVKLATFDALLSVSDFVIVACNLNDQTLNLFNEAAFSKMKSNAILVNIARGPIVNHDALLHALQQNKIAGAGLDVTVPEPLPKNDPLLKLSNCVVLPHMGSNTMDTRNMMCDLAVTNLINGLQGKDMVSEVKL